MSSIAIIGTGIAGMGAAHLLHDQYDIAVFEQNDYVGGHTNTVSVEEDGRSVAIDTGFIVFNYHTYPHLCALFEALDVAVQKTDMSFGVQYKPSGLEYCGTSLNHLFAQRKNIFSVSYIKFLLQINKFNRECVEVLDGSIYQDYSVKDYVNAKRYSEDFTFKYLLPMTAALWSTPTDITLQFPIVSLVRFFKNHGFLGLNTQFQWYTVSNGSQQYREKLIAPFRDKIKLNSKVVAVKRSGSGVKLTTIQGEMLRFDKVVFACHADQALDVLQDATAKEQSLLKPFQYQKNKATLHSDSTVMPKNRLTWSAWNYRIDDIKGQKVPHCVYYMNRLQNLETKQDYFLSINDPGLVDPKKILKVIEYEHPIFTVEAMQTQQHLYMLNENELNTYFCGSYFKYGFHEDALASAMAISEKLTKVVEWT